MEVVRLNVGGTVFTTTRGTLEPAAYFAALDRFGGTERTVDGAPFVDRDPEGFRHVLGWLRDPQYPFPPDKTYELDFYGIEWRTGAPDDEPPEQSHPVDAEGLREALFGKPPGDADPPIHSDAGMAGLITSLAARGPRDVQPFRESGGTPFFGYFSRYGADRFVSRRSAVGILSNPPGELRVSRSGDCCKRIWLQVKTIGPNPPNRHGLFDIVDLVVGGKRVSRLTGDLFALLELVQKPKSVRDYDAAEDARTGTICVGLPFWFSNVFGRDDEYDASASLPMLSLQFHEVEVKPAWADPEAIDRVDLVAEYAYLDEEERRELARERFIGATFHWKEATGNGCDVVRILVEGWGPTDRFLFAFRTELGQLLPVRAFSIILNGHSFCHVSGRMLAEQMAALGYLPDQPVYLYRVGGSPINLYRIDSVEVVVELFPGYPKGRVLLFGRTRNEMAYVDGMAGLRWVE